MVSSKSSCDHSAPVSFPFWPFLMCGVCYPNPGAPLHPGMFLSLCPSSVQQPSVTLSKYAFYSTCSFCLCHLHPTPSRNSLVFIRLVFVFFVALISGGIFLLCSRTLYASTWFAYLDSLARLGFSLSHCLWPQNLYLSTMKNQEGHWGYCWCRWVERIKVKSSASVPGYESTTKKNATRNKSYEKNKS